MAKLLIIEDHLKMVELLQKYFETINSHFTKKNTFCFSTQNGSLHIQPLDKVDCSLRTIMSGKKEEVFSQVFHFLNKNCEEAVLILIDVLLNSQNISAPSYERYRADGEYSCELYAELIRIKNGKKIKSAKNIDPDKFYHIIYSRSDASIGVVTTVLDDLYDKQEEALFPKECTLFKNISWCRNCFDTTNQDLSVSATQQSVAHPLALPKEYKAFLKDLK